ncbi:MAG TPA: DUF2953 domain-containing protein [Polyangiales bacterium]|nr:DUF2953 domain-containing protein [Polyangiales bacterium]
MLTRAGLVCHLCFVLAACAGSGQMVCRPDSISGSERCQQTGGAADAAITGGVAGGLWAVKGCTINGCEPPFVCNPKSKQCERQKCSETAACPPGYQCSDQACR